MASDDKNLVRREGANASSSEHQQPGPLTVTPELSRLLHRTTELAAAAASRPAAGDEAVFPKGEEEEEEVQTMTNADCSRRRTLRPGSGSGQGGGSLRLRRLPSSRCPSCSGAPFTDATFCDYSDDGDDGSKSREKEPPQTLLENSRLWLLENGRSLSAPLLALLVAAASVSWSLYEYAGSSAAALGGPALYLAKACVATSQASYGMVFLPVSRGLVTTLR
jgi:hypothetical protein